MTDASPVVSIIMGSQSDWPTMRPAADILSEFGIPFEARIISAHRTPKRVHDYMAGTTERGLKVIIAGAGGAAHLAGSIAALTTLPVLGVPVESQSLKGLDSLLSTVQMPGGTPVGTLGIGPSGAKNAALLAVAILALSDGALAQSLTSWRERQSQAVPVSPSDS
ncbi:MAG: 5-(carboxyamino)imidazole ribonucleotide mutase [Sphingomonadales bacterium]